MNGLCNILFYKKKLDIRYETIVDFFKYTMLNKININKIMNERLFFFFF